MKQIFTVTAFLLLIVIVAKAQKSERPEQFPFAYASSSFQIPGGDLANRFGASFDIGGGLGYKLQSNIVLGIESSYIFGNKVKENTLQGLLNKYDQITNQYGEIAEIVMRESGFQIKATAGKIIPVFGSNKNSGIFLRGGLGLLQHKIYIENKQNNTPQISGDYLKGYDRMCAGFLASEFVGWQNFSEKSAYHFMVGFEFSQAFTKNQRSWDYATNKKIDKQRLDLIYSLKIAYFIPFIKREVTNYFYN